MPNPILLGKSFPAQSWSLGKFMRNLIINFLRREIIRVRQRCGPGELRRRLDGPRDDEHWGWRGGAVMTGSGSGSGTAATEEEHGECCGDDEAHDDAEDDPDGGGGVHECAWVQVVGDVDADGASGWGWFLSDGTEAGCGGGREGWSDDRSDGYEFGADPAHGAGSCGETGYGSGSLERCDGSDLMGFRAERGGDAGGDFGAASGRC